ncbi:MAG: hypothetical protein N2448_06485 [Caloramator sp.]|nr:hypothetical protein [Caloramator sp.]
MKKNKGAVQIIILSSWILFILIILIMFTLEIYMINIKAERAQDDIVLSNLAVYKDIDLKALGDTAPVIKISEPMKAFQTFKTYLKKNMYLDENMNGTDRSVAVGNVNIESYIIYNVSGYSMQIFTYNTAANNFDETIVNDVRLNPVFSPSGNRVVKTSIYTKLSFNVQTFLDSDKKLRKVFVHADTNITN